MDMVNSIADMSIAMAGNQLMTNVSTAVLDMTMDTYQEQAAHQSPCAEDQQHYGCRRTQQSPFHDTTSVAGTSAVLLVKSSPSMNSCIRVQ